VEEDFKQPAFQASPPPDSPPSDALTWACDILDLQTDEQAIGKKETRRQAMKSFFNGLRSNDFRVQQDAVQAAEVIYGKSTDLVPACLRGQKKKQFQQLDDLVEWYASQLGEQDNQRLLADLGQQLAGFNTDVVPEEVKSYGKKIWQSASSMKALLSKQDPAALKVCQALFHISTVRPSRRRQVRSQHVAELREKFSISELASAKRVLRLRQLGSDEWLHRPFLTLLTCDREQVENCRLGRPVAAGAQTVAYAKDFGSTKPAANAHTRLEPKTNWSWLTLLIVGSLISIVIRVGAFSSGNSSNGPNKPNIRYNVPKYNAPNSRSRNMQGVPGMPGPPSSAASEMSVQEIIDMMKRAKEIEDSMVTSPEAESLDSGSGRPGNSNLSPGSDPFQTVDETWDLQAESQKQFEESIKRLKKDRNPIDFNPKPTSRPKNLHKFRFGNGGDSKKWSNP